MILNEKMRTTHKGTGVSRAATLIFLPLEVSDYDHYTFALSKIITAKNGSLMCHKRGYECFSTFMCKLQEKETTEGKQCENSNKKIWRCPYAAYKRTCQEMVLFYPILFFKLFACCLY